MKAMNDRMNTCIALFRGINVGGHNALPMASLRALLADMGFHNVNTYIQSGNVLFQADEAVREGISAEISARVEAAHGFRPEVLVLELDEMEEAVANNPFPEAVAEPRSLHLNFLVSEPSNPDLDALEACQKESERFELIGRVFYLHAPEGIGRSRLARRTEKALGVSMTGRNWRTVQKIMEMGRAY